MPRATVEKGRPYFFDEGAFLAACTKVTDKKVEFVYQPHHKAVQRGKAKAGDLGTVHTWVWTWQLMEGDQAGCELDQETNPSIELEGYSPARANYEALSRKHVDLGQDVDTDTVVGLRATIVLAHAKPRVVDDRTFYDTKVVDVRALSDDAPGRDPWVGDDAPGRDPWVGDEPPF